MKKINKFLRQGKELFYTLLVGILISAAMVIVLKLIFN